MELFFTYLYSKKHFEIMLDELELFSEPTIASTEVQHRNLKQVAVSHCIPLEETSLDITGINVMCPFTDLQLNMHTYVMKKLKRAVESRSLMEFLEAVTQELSICQHPMLFDCNSSDEDKHFKSSKTTEIVPQTKIWHFPETLEISVPKFVLFDQHNDHVPSTYTGIADKIKSVNTIMLHCLKLKYNTYDENVTESGDLSQNQPHNYNSFEKPFLSSQEIDILKYELEFSEDKSGFPKTMMNLKYLFQKSSSQTEFIDEKLNLFNSTRMTAKIIDDLNLKKTELTALDKMCSITDNTKSFVCSSFNVIVNPAKVKLYCGANCSIRTDEDIPLISKALGFDNKYELSSQSFYSDCLFSGKLRTLQTLLRSLIQKNSKKFLILSHNYELLHFVNDLLYSRFHYEIQRFLFFITKQDDKICQMNVITKFNNFDSSYKCPVLLAHTKDNIHELCRILPTDLDIIIMDHHWQIDADDGLTNILSRLSINYQFLNRCNTPAIYRLCTFDSLEQYFVKYNLKFLLNNCYFDKHATLISTNSFICQQAILKHFVEKLNGHMKEYLISGFYIDDFQTSLDKNDSLQKTPVQCIRDIITSFETVQDMNLLNQFRNRLAIIPYEMNHLNWVSDLEYCFRNTTNLSNMVDHYVEAENDLQFYTRWEKIRYEREKEFNQTDYATENPQVIFYDPQYLKLIDSSVVWGPPVVDNNANYVPVEISDMYDLKPMTLADNTVYTVPNKMFTLKNKKWDQKCIPTNFKIKDEYPQSIKYDFERVKKRKVIDDGELTRYPVSHKKRRTQDSFLLTDNPENSTNFVKSNYKIEKSISENAYMKESVLNNKELSEPMEVQTLVEKEFTETSIKKHSPSMVEESPPDAESLLYPLSSQPAALSIGNLCETSRSNNLAVSNGISKLNIQRPLYTVEGQKTLKLKRQQLTSNSSVNLNVGTAATFSSTLQPQKLLMANRGPMVIHSKPGNNEFQTSTEDEAEKVLEWDLYEEAFLYQNVYHFQQFNLPAYNERNLSGAPNFKVIEFYLYMYGLNTIYRNSDSCKVQFDKLQDSLTNYVFTHSLQRNKVNPPAATSVSYVDSRSSIDSKLNSAPGRKMKLKMKSFGSNITPNSQTFSNKIRLFQNVSSDMKIGLTKTNQIAGSCANSTQTRINVIVNMVDDVVNRSRLPPPNPSQTIKKNVTHTNILEENNIHPDKIFTPAMLIQRREEMNKEKETEATISRQQSIPNSVSNFRSHNYYENPASSHVRRTHSANVNANQQFYTVQQPQPTNVSRPRYAMPGTRQLSGTIRHQPVSNANAIPSTNNIPYSNSGVISNAPLVMSQNPSISLTTKAPPHFQLQPSSRSVLPSAQRRGGQYIQRLMPIRQNQFINRSATGSYVRSLNPSVINQATAQNLAGSSNPIITVLPNNIQETTNIGILSTPRQMDGRNLSQQNPAQIRGTIRGNLNSSHSNSKNQTFQRMVFNRTNNNSLQPRNQE